MARIPEHEIVAAKPDGVNLSFDTYSNGINAGGSVAAGMAPGALLPSLVVAPNTASPSAVQAIDQADGAATQVYISNNDPALGMAVFGAMLSGAWQEAFGDRVHVTEQASHNLDRYHDAALAQDRAEVCAGGNTAACK